MANRESAMLESAATARGVGGAQNSVGVYINSIGLHTPPFQGHQEFLDFAPQLLRRETAARDLKLFQRLAQKSQIERRYSVLTPQTQLKIAEGELDRQGLYRAGAFASTQKRMEVYKAEAPKLAMAAARKVLPSDRSEVTHLIAVSCTGFMAPGLDLMLQQGLELRRDLKRSVIGFMGCYASFNALRLAWSIVRSEPQSKVLVVSCELCSLHLQDDPSLEELLGYLQFADGAAAALVSAEPRGLRVNGFETVTAPSRSDLIQWDVGDSGFKMFLSLDVPKAVGEAVDSIRSMLQAYSRYAIHPGGRAVLDAVEAKLELAPSKLAFSRDVLRNFGNMSSATILFVLERFLNEQNSESAEGPGVAMAFGPGLTVETMSFQ